MSSNTPSSPNSLLYDAEIIRGTQGSTLQSSCQHDNMQNVPKTSSIFRRTGAIKRSSNWSFEEDEILGEAVRVHGGKNWKKIAMCLPGRTGIQCLHRWKKVLNPDLVKGPWNTNEDEQLSQLVKKYGAQNWSQIASKLPGRSGKQCRERWFNNLDPTVKKSHWTPEEDEIIIDKQANLGNKWSEIAKFLPGRAGNDVKNRYHSLSKNCKRKKRINNNSRNEDVNMDEGSTFLNEETIGGVAQQLPKVSDFENFQIQVLPPPAHLFPTFLATSPTFNYILPKHSPTTPMQPLNTNLYPSKVIFAQVSSVIPNYQNHPHSTLKLVDNGALLEQRNRLLPSISELLQEKSSGSN